MDLYTEKGGSVKCQDIEQKDLNRMIIMVQIHIFTNNIIPNSPYLVVDELKGT